MTKKIVLTALSLALVVGVIPAHAEIIDYGYGGTGTYGNSYGAVSISRDLTFGSYGADVIALESFLRGRGFMTVTGSGYFSAATRDAVARFQASVGIYPASGYFGPLTRAYYNAQAGSSYQQPGYDTQYPYGGTAYGCPSGTYAVYYGGQLGCVNRYYDSSGNDDDRYDDLEGGSASLRGFDVDEGDDTDIEEGDDRAEVAEVTFDVRGGDVRVERVDLRFEFVGNVNDADEEPWNVFDRVRLVADGDTIADVDTGRRSDWDEDGDGYVLRLDDLDDYVIREGDEADLVIEVDVANNVQGSDDDSVRWDIGVADDGIRVVDGDDDDHEIGDEDRTVRIEIAD